MPHKGDDRMKSECNYFSSSIGKNMLLECRKWLEQYKKAYDIMDRVCSSDKGNRYSLKLSTKINKEKNPKGKERYNVALNLERGQGEVFLEGPSISIPSDAKNIVAAVTIGVLEHGVKMHPKYQENISSLLTDGTVKFDKPVRMKGYHSATTIYDLRDVVSDKQVLEKTKEVLVNDNSLVNEQIERLGHIEAYSYDKKFLDSKRNSDNSYRNVLKFDTPITKRKVR